MRLRNDKTKRRNQRRLRRIETLEPRIVLDSRILVTEFVASNDDGILDEDGDSSDWIELLNVGSETADLEGWHLTDDAADLNKWELPAIELTSGEYFVVFASSKDRDDPVNNLHTNFRLSSGGEYLALTRPDQSIEFEYAPQYPQQVEDVAFGIPNGVFDTELVAPGDAAELLIPTDGALDPDLANEIIEGSWIDPALDTAGPEWSDVLAGVGFWTRRRIPIRFPVTASRSRIPWLSFRATKAKTIGSTGTGDNPMTRTVNIGRESSCSLSICLSSA